MASRAETEYRYEKLTWPEINEAIEQRQVCIVPCGAVEQHGEFCRVDHSLPIATLGHPKSASLETLVPKYESTLLEG